MFPKERRMFPEYGPMFPEYRQKFPGYGRMFLNTRRITTGPGVVGAEHDPNGVARGSKNVP